MIRDDEDDDEIVITIEGRGATIVDALANVLLGAQDRLRATDSAADTRDD